MRRELLARTITSGMVAEVTETGSTVEVVEVDKMTTDQPITVEIEVTTTRIGLSIIEIGMMTDHHIVDDDETL